MVNMRRGVTVDEQGLLLGRQVSTHDRMISIGIGSFSIINTTFIKCINIKRSIRYSIDIKFKEIQFKKLL